MADKPTMTRRQIIHAALDRALTGPETGDPRRAGSPADRLEYLTDAVWEDLRKHGMEFPNGDDK